MNATAAQLFAALDAQANTTTTAAALGVSKQTYSIARQRGSISDALCIRAAALLHLDPAQTLFAMHRDDATTPELRAVWENALQRITPTPQPVNERTGKANPHPAKDSSNQPSGYLYYVNSECQRLNGDDRLFHVRPSKRKRIDDAANLARWMLCIPKISPLSPRFKYYADNWNVLGKIATFSASGELAVMLKDSPAFSAEELRAALDYLDDFDANRAKPKTAANATAGTRPALVA